MKTILFTKAYSLFCAVCSDLEKRGIEYKTRENPMGHSILVNEDRYEFGLRLAVWRKGLMKKEGLI